MSDHNNLEIRIKELEDIIASKDEELELAANLGQALVRKETKQAELLEKAKQRIKALEDEVIRLQEKDRKSLSEIETENADLKEQVRKWEDQNYKLQYELKRKELQLEHVQKKSKERDEELECKEANAAHGEKDKEIARLEAKIARLNRDHEQSLNRLIEEHVNEMESLKRANELQLQEYVRQSEEETKSLMENMELQLQVLREEIQAKFIETSAEHYLDAKVQSCVEDLCEEAGLKGRTASAGNADAMNSFSSKYSTGKRRDTSTMSFASKFSTETLELDLDLAGDDEFCFDMHHVDMPPLQENDESKILPEDDDEEAQDQDQDQNQDGDEQEKGQEAEQDVEQDVEQDEHRQENVNNVGRNIVQAKDQESGNQTFSSDEAGASASISGENRKVVPSLPPPVPVATVRCRTTAQVQSSGNVDDGDDGMSLQDILRQGPQLLAQEGSESGKDSFSKLSVSSSVGSVSGAKKRGGARLAKRLFSATGAGSSTAEFCGEDWKQANKCSAYIQMVFPKGAGGNNRGKKWSARFCVYLRGIVYIFRNEADALKYSQQESQPAGTKPKTTVQPLVQWSMSGTEIRVIRRPAASGENGADARSSMISWLKKRNQSGMEADEPVGKGKGTDGNEVYKIQLIERDANGGLTEEHHSRSLSMSTRSTRSGSTSTSRSFNSSFSEEDFHDSQSNAKDSAGVQQQPKSVYLAFASEAERVRWVEAFISSGGCSRVDAGTIWVHQKKTKKEEWIKRYAVMVGARLELYEYGTEKLRETVSLLGAKVEPAYSAHIFISHKAHQKQLVTLRAYDGTERNWWVGGLRVSVSMVTDKDKKKDRGNKIEYSPADAAAATPRPETKQVSHAA